MLKKISILIFCFILLFSCGKNDSIITVNLNKKEIQKIQPKSLNDESIKIIVGGKITPKEGFGYYKHLLDYIGEKIGKHVIFMDREDNAEINKLIKTGSADLAFVCAGPYVDGHDEFGMELLVAPVPQVYGKAIYYSYILVHKDSKISSFEELKGKTFAFTDPLSNAGTLVPTYMLAKINETPKSFFKKYIHSKSHNTAIKAVAEKIVDGCATDGLIWEYFNRINPEFTSQTKIIKKSPPYGIPPVVVRQGLNPELKNKLREIFLNIHKDVNGKEILKGIMIDKFVVTYDSSYNSIRELKKFIKTLRK